jgi:hypothetical protein
MNAKVVATIQVVLGGVVGLLWVGAVVSMVRMLASWWVEMQYLSVDAYPLW